MREILHNMFATKGEMKLKFLFRILSTDLILMRRQ